jgi:6-pyruvoyltetrahydropterin 2'-reductase
MVAVTEIFPAMQCEGCGGEHSTYGWPTVFFRLGTGCTLTCKGFGVPVIKDGVHLKDKDGELMYGCDSFDSVYSEFKGRSKQYTAEELIAEYYKNIPKVSVKNQLKPTITISGGEPCLFLRDEELQRFITFFTSRDVKVMIETNGTVKVDFELGTMRKVMFSISPKLASAGDPQSKRIKLDVLEDLIQKARTSYLKFVVSEDNWEEEYAEIKMILDGIPSYVPNILLMGQGGKNDEKFKKNEKFAYLKAMELGFMFSPRTHISLFSDEKLR